VISAHSGLLIVLCLFCSNGDLFRSVSVSVQVPRLVIWLDRNANCVQSKRPTKAQGHFPYRTDDVSSVVCLVHGVVSHFPFLTLGNPLLQPPFHQAESPFLSPLSPFSNDYSAGPTSVSSTKTYLHIQTDRRHTGLSRYECHGEVGSGSWCGPHGRGRARVAVDQKRSAERWHGIGCGRLSPTAAVRPPPSWCSGSLHGRRVTGSG
jgi:hypothetical protein